MANEISTAIIVDSIGTSFGGPDEEFEYIERVLKNLGLPVSVRAKSDIGLGEIINKRFDLIVVDYGGIASLGAQDTAVFHVREIIQWAADHPSSAVLIWSYFTWELYEYEIKEAFGDLANLFFYSVPGKPLPEAKLQNSYEDEIVEKLCTWFGVPRGKGFEGGKLNTPDSWFPDLG